MAEREREKERVRGKRELEREKERERESGRERQMDTHIQIWQNLNAVGGPFAGANLLMVTVLGNNGGNGSKMVCRCSPCYRCHSPKDGPN